MHKEVTPEIRDEALAFLNQHKKMVLSILDIEKHPNSSLLLYAVDDEFKMYFGTCKHFGKYAALSADPHVSLAVVEEKIDPLKVIDMQGRVEEISSQKTSETLKFFESKNSSKFYVKGEKDFVMFKVIPTHVRWLDASDGKLQMYDII
jgi:general stress protein 26